jgi:osmotically-inducible protein OsmY
MGAACVMLATAPACTRHAESSAAGSGASATPVHDDVKQVARATQKAARDIGQATGDIADKAGDGLKDATNKAGASGEDAWITTKVKSALMSEGFDPMAVHVDTDGKVVTLSGTVASTEKREKAVSLAKGVTGVADVKDHLFLKTEK